MEIAAALEITLQDFPGKIAAEIFTRGCNFRCPHCHAKPVLEGTLPPVRQEDVLSYCSSSGWVNGISICGGEPSLQPGLEAFIKKARSIGLAIKLDTNGSHPEILEKLLAEGLIDYLAMDIKGPLELWNCSCGIKCPAEKMKASILLAQFFPQHEFRTTAAPIARPDGMISFMTADEIGKTAHFIAEHTGCRDHQYFIQKFIPRANGLLDARMEKFPKTPDNLLYAMLEAASKWLPAAQLRG